MTVPAWFIPLVLTAAVWGWEILRPTPRRLDFDFGGAIEDFGRVSICLIATLVFWLIYFIIRGLQ